MQVLGVILGVKRSFKLIVFSPLLSEPPSSIEFKQTIPKCLDEYLVGEIAGITLTKPESIERRYHSMGNLADDLQRFIDGAEVYGRLSCHEGPKRSLTQPNLVLNP